MRTNVAVDEDVLKEALELSDSDDASAVVEKQLREMIRYRRVQRKILELEGKVDWEGDLDAMRRDR